MPHRIVGIDIGAAGIKAVFIDTTFRGYTVVDCRHLPMPSPEEYDSIPLNLSNAANAEGNVVPLNDEVEAAQDGDDEETQEPSDEQPPEPDKHFGIPPYVYGLAKLIHSPGIHINDAVVNVPGHLVSNHIIDVPFSDRRRIERVLPIEVENYIPFDVEDVVMSYQIISSSDEGAKLLVSLVKHVDMQSFLENLKLAGLNPTIIDIGPNALVNALRLKDDTDGRPSMLVHIGEQQTDVALVNDGVPFGVRILPVGAEHLTRNGQTNLRPLLQKLRQTVQSARMEIGTAIELIETTGAISLDESFNTSLADALQTEVRPFAPYDGEFDKTIDPTDQVNALFSKGLGLALRQTPFIRDPQINLRQGPFAFRREGGFLKENMKKFVAMGVVLLVLVGYNGVYAHLQNRQQAEQVREQIIKVFNQTFPGERVVNPVEQFKMNMESVNKKYKLVGYLGNGNLRAVDLLKQISEAMPPNVKIDIKKLDLTQDKLIFEGVTDNFKQVDSIEAALRQVDSFVKIKKDQTSRDANDRIKFKFIIGLTEKEDSSGGLLGGRKTFGGQ